MGLSVGPRPSALVGLAALLIAGCTALPFGSPPPLSASDCFGDVGYAFAGWTTLEAIDELDDAPDHADGRVYALITRGEVELAVQPAANGGSTALIGRGVCWTRPGIDGVRTSAFGPIRTEPRP